MGLILNMSWDRLTGLKVRFVTLKGVSKTVINICLKIYKASETYGIIMWGVWLGVLFQDCVYLKFSGPEMSAVISPRWRKTTKRCDFLLKKTKQKKPHVLHV